MCLRIIGGAVFVKIPQNTAAFIVIRIGNIDAMVIDIAVCVALCFIQICCIIAHILTILFCCIQQTVRMVIVLIQPCIAVRIRVARCIGIICIDVIHFMLVIAVVGSNRCIMNGLGIAGCIRIMLVILVREVVVDILVTSHAAVIRLVVSIHICAMDSIFRSLKCLITIFRPVNSIGFIGIGDINAGFVNIIVTILISTMRLIVGFSIMVITVIVQVFVPLIRGIRNALVGLIRFVVKIKPCRVLVFDCPCISFVCTIIRICTCCITGFGGIHLTVADNILSCKRSICRIRCLFILGVKPCILGIIAVLIQVVVKLAHLP